MGSIHKFTGDGEQFDWQDVPVLRYSGDCARPVRKRELISERDGAEHFVVRYFEVPPHERTNLDQHAHDHGVFVVRGSGILRLGDEKVGISFGDAIYIEPFEIHQFENNTDQPLGFLCVIKPKTSKGAGSTP